MTSVAFIVCGLSLVAAAGASAPKVTATVTTTSATLRLVRIVNRDHVTYRDFVVESKNAPRILKATKPCSVVQRDGNYNGTKFNWRYRTECKRAVRPRKAFTIAVTTSGKGPITVYVVVNDDFVRINK